MNSAIIWICAAIAFAVFGVMLYSVATFRAAPPAIGAARHHNAVVETFWTLIPIAIFVGAVLPVLRDQVIR